MCAIQKVYILIRGNGNLYEAQQVVSGPQDSLICAWCGFVAGDGSGSVMQYLLHFFSAIQTYFFKSISSENFFCPQLSSVLGKEFVDALNESEEQEVLRRGEPEQMTSLVSVLCHL